MRIITTWMYFDPSQVKSEREYNRPRGRGDELEPGIGIAWCAGDTTKLMPFSSLKAFHELPIEGDELGEEQLRQYVDAFLTDGQESDFIRPSRTIRNPDVVSFVIDEPFVIQKSPPDLLSLKGAITKTNLPIWIGTYMGWSVVPDRSVLLFIAVPGGIIIVSSAIGIASALASGLSTSVKRLFRVK